MKDLRDRYFEANDTATKNAYYIFVVPGFDNAGVTGYMVRGRALGFVKAGSDALVYAHELGHGIGALKHTWQDGGPEEGKTNNLMDYDDGIESGTSISNYELTKFQWKEMRDLDVVPGMFDEVEDAAYSIILQANMSGALPDIVGATEETNELRYYFLTPSGVTFKPINYEAFEITKWRSGCINEFVYEGITYTGIYIHTNGVLSGFACYYNKQEWLVIEDSVSTAERWKALEDEGAFFNEGIHYTLGKPNNKVYSEFVKPDCKKVFATWDILTSDNGHDILLSQSFYGGVGTVMDILPVDRSFYNYEETEIVAISEIQCRLANIKKVGRYGQQFVNLYFDDTYSDEDKLEILKIAELYDTLGLDLLKDMDSREINSLYKIFHAKDLGPGSFISYRIDIELYVEELAEAINVLENAGFSNQQSEVVAAYSGYNYSNAQLRLIPIDTRVALLKSLSNGYMNSGEWTTAFGQLVPTENAENFGLRLIQTVHDDDILLFHEKLQNASINGVSVFQNLVSGYHDDEYFFGDSHFREFMTTLFEQCLKKETKSPQIKYEEMIANFDNDSKGYFINYKHGGDESTNCRYYVNLPETNQLEFSSGTTWFNIEYGENCLTFELFFQTLGEYFTDAFSEEDLEIKSFNERLLEISPQYDFSYRPLDDWVILYSHEDLHNVGFEAYEAKLVPSFVLMYLLNEEESAENREAFWTTVEIASWAIGVGEIAAGARGLKLVVAIIDVAAATADFAIGHGIDDQIIAAYAAEGKEEEGKSVVRNIRTVLTIIQLGSSGGLVMSDLVKINTKFPKIADDFTKHIDELKLKNANNPNTIDASELNKLESISDNLKQTGVVGYMAQEGSGWLENLESLLGGGSKTKIQGWLDKGLDATKVEQAFANAADKTNLFNKLDNAKSIQHQKVLTNDLDNIPGVISGQYVSNSVDNVTQNIVKTTDNKQFTLKPYQAETFQKNANLINRTDIEVIEDLNNGIQLVKVNPGTKIYRVYDGYQQGVNTLPKGNYWTFEKPASISEVIGGTAVQPEWNSMTKIIEVEVPSQGIYVWRGKAAKQPLSNNENISNYFLQGGTEQLIFDINQNAINIPSITNNITNTPW